MKTINELTAARIENHEAFFARKKALGTAMEKLVDIYNATTRPDATVAAFKVEVGEDTAIEVIASMVNQKAWDGRIDRRVKAWAAEQENAWDEQAANKLGLCTDRIHPAHLNQIADAMM